MPRPAAILCCSVLHLSCRLLRLLDHRFPCPPNHSLPSFPLSSRHRLLSSSSAPGAARWATYGPLTSSHSASASETPTDTESDTWTFYDPISGRIVTQSPPHSSSTAEAEEEGAGEREDEEKARVKEKVKWKGRRRTGASGEEGRARRSSSAAAAAADPARKGDKERISYECTLCGEGEPRWWGYCRHCQAMGSLVKTVLPEDSNSSSNAEANDVDEEKGEGAGECQDEEEVRVKEKGKWKRRDRRSSGAAVRNPKANNKRVSYVCTLCGEGSSEWWGKCRHCNATGTLARDA